MWMRVGRGRSGMGAVAAAAAAVCVCVCVCWLVGFVSVSATVVFSLSLLSTYVVSLM